MKPGVVEALGGQVVEYGLEVGLALQVAGGVEPLEARPDRFAVPGVPAFDIAADMGFDLACAHLLAPPCFNQFRRISPRRTGFQPWASGYTVAP
jgi:hypothetical protein